MNSRVSLTLGHDLVMAALSFYIALYLRLGPGLFELSQQIVGLGLIAFIACHVPSAHHVMSSQKRAPVLKLFGDTSAHHIVTLRKRL